MFCVRFSIIQTVRGEDAFIENEDLYNRAMSVFGVQSLCQTHFMTLNEMQKCEKGKAFVV